MDDGRVEQVGVQVGEVRGVLGGDSNVVDVHARGYGGVGFSFDGPPVT
ncbi:hypothetical protein [Halorussus caseinilyticus]|uniref:Uncharacterized protein n=1 Tax=Halorussus caseinilyticus TaxID=3034025 RepID=A0ABD5WQX4_9EURY